MLLILYLKVESTGWYGCMNSIYLQQGMHMGIICSILQVNINIRKVHPRRRVLILRLRSLLVDVSHDVTFQF